MRNCNAGTPGVRRGLSRDALDDQDRTFCRASAVVAACGVRDEVVARNIDALAASGGGGGR